VLGVFSELLLKKKNRNLYIFEESLFSDMTPICHLWDMIENDPLYNPLIVE